MPEKTQILDIKLNSLQDTLTVSPAMPGSIVTINGISQPMEGTTVFYLKSHKGYVLGKNVIHIENINSYGDITGYKRAKKLLDIDVVADYLTLQLNIMGEQTKFGPRPGENFSYKHNTPYKIETITNLGPVQLREKAISNKDPQLIPASLNLINGTIGDNVQLDMYNYDLQYFFIATVETAKTLKERIDTFVYNNQGRSLPISQGYMSTYNCVAKYSLAVIGQPFMENGEERVAISWYIALDLVKQGVYAEDVNWSLKINGIEYPLVILTANIATSYGTEPIQTAGTLNVQSDLTNRSIGWTFTIPYTQSDLTTLLVKNYLLSTAAENDAFFSPIELKYSETREKNDSWEKKFQVHIVNVKFAMEAGKIIGLSFDCVEGA